MAEANTLARAVGRRIRELRDAHGWVQEDVAAIARVFGLDWTRATVAAIETGRRNLSAEELLLLPVLFGNLRGFALLKDGEPPASKPEDLDDFFPDGEEVVLTPSVSLLPELLRALVSGRYGKDEKERLDSMAATMEGLRGEAGEAEERAALRLGVTVVDIMATGQRLWGRSLTEERDRRVAERGSDIPLESRRAIRGRVTRKLIEELGAVLEEEGPPEKESPRAVGEKSDVGKRIVRPKARAAKAMTRRGRR